MTIPSNSTSDSGSPSEGEPPQSGRAKNALRWLRRLAWVVAGLLGLVIVVVAGLIGALQTEYGRRFVVDTVEELATGAGLTLKIDRLGAGLPVRLDVSGVRIADDKGEWLSLDEGVVAWRPFDLLRRQFTIEEITLKGANVIRPPDLPPTEEPEEEPDTGLPTLPVAIAIHRIDIPDLSLGAAIIGTETKLSLEGEAKATSTTAGTADFTLKREDGHEGGARLTATWDVAADHLALDLDASEPAGGLVMALAGQSPAEAWHFKVSGDGKLSAWPGKLDVAAEGLVSLTGDLTIDAVKQQRATLSALVKAPTLIPPAIEPATRDGVGLLLDVRRKSTNEIEILALNATGTGMSVAGKGDLDFGASEIDAQVTASLEPTALAAEALGTLKFKAVNARTTATGDLSEPALTVEADVADIAAAPVNIASTKLNASLTPSKDLVTEITGEGAKQALAVDASLTGITTDDAAIGAVLGDQATLSTRATLPADNSRIDIQSLAAKTRAVTIDGSGGIAFGEGDTDFALKIDGPDLALLRKATGQALAGQPRVEARLKGPSDGAKIVGTIEAAVSGLSLGTPAADAALGDRPTLNTTLALGEEGDAAIRSLTLRARSLSADGKASRRADGTLDGEIRADVPDLSKLSVALGTPMAGSMTAIATIVGNEADPEAKLVVNGRRLDLDPLKNASLTATVTAVQLATSPNGKLNAQLDTERGPVIADAMFALPPAGGWSVPAARLTGLGLTVTASAAQPSKPGALIDGHVDARYNVGQAPQGVSGPWLTGQATLTADLGESAQRQAVSFAINAKDLVVGVEHAVTARVGGIDGSGRVLLAGSNPKESPLNASATLRATKLEAAGRMFESIEMEADGNPQSATLKASVFGAPKSHDRLDLAAITAVNGPSTSIRLDQLAGQLAGQSILLRQPLVVRSAGPNLSVGALDLAIGTGSLRGQVDKTERTTSVNLVIGSLPLAILDAASPQAKLHGTLDGAIDLSTQGGKVGGTVSLSARDVSRQGFRFGPGDEASLDLHADWRNDVVNANGNVRAFRDAGLTFTAQAPATMAGGTFAPVIKPDDPLSATATIDAQLATIVRVLAIDDQRMSGKIGGQVNVGGTMNAPAIAPDIRLTDGAYENFVTGTLFKKITASIHGDMVQGIVVDASATDSNKGELGVTGTVTESSEEGIGAEVALTTKQATIVRRDDVTATVTTNIKTDVNASGGSVTGEVVSDRIEIRLINLLPPTVINLHPIEINKPGGSNAPPPPPENESPAWVADLKVRLSLPQKVFVRGRGLDSEWSGNLDITGTTAAPSVAGTITLVRGHIDFASKRLNLTQGTIAFSSGKTIDPVLNIVAEQVLDDLTAVVTIRGPASKPKIEITSRPPRPEGEVLSQMLFGKSASKLGPVEAIQLAAATDSLARGEGISDDVLSYARTLLGVDTLSIDTGEDENGGTTADVSAGRYIGDDIYVGARSTGGGQGGAGTVQIQILPGLSIESEVGQSNTNGDQETSGTIGLRYRYDY